MHRRILAFKYAYKGLVELIRSQPNFSIHLSATVIVIVAGFYFQIEKYEWLALILTIGFVLVTESLNTAAEYMVDLVSPDFDRLAGKIKDVAAAAVLIASVMSVIIGILIFWPHFSGLWQNT